MNTITSLGYKWQGFKQITRINKPIGIYLLLWPTFWALWIASNGSPSFHLLFVFTLGVIIMRSAGCVINDFADRKIDGKVMRTELRPLITGLLTPKEAMAIFIGLLLLALSLVLTLKTSTVLLSFVAVGLATLYPFMKRYTHLPQVVLGAAFSWGIIMAFEEAYSEITLVAWLLFLANVLWTVAYDTMYAMVDKDDDVNIGVRSTAILFGDNDKKIVGLLQMLTLGCLFTVGELLAFGWPYHVTLIISAGLFTYQQILISGRDRDKCFRAFLNNHFVGLVVFIGIFIEHV